MLNVKWLRHRNHFHAPFWNNFDPYLYIKVQTSWHLRRLFKIKGQGHENVHQVQKIKSSIFQLYALSWRHRVNMSTGYWGTKHSQQGFWFYCKTFSQLVALIREVSVSIITNRVFMIFGYPFITINTKAIIYKWRSLNILENIS